MNPTTGALTKVGAAPPGHHGSVALHPSGSFAYATGAGPAGGIGPIFVYAIDGNGALTPVVGSPFAGASGGGAVTIDPTGEFAYVANKSFDAPGRVSAYSINATTGALTPVAGSPFATLTGPTKIVIDPQGAFLYVACNGGPTHFGGLLGFSINRSTGALTPLSGSPFSPADHYSMAIDIDSSGKYMYERAWRASNPAALRTLSIASTGALEEVPNSRLLLEPGWSVGIALTR